jgi:hypothetical protein
MAKIIDITKQLEARHILEMMKKCQIATAKLIELEVDLMAKQIDREILAEIGLTPEDLEEP